MNEYTKYLALKSAIESLFGSNAWYALKESNHIPTWRKYGIKILQAIEKAINSTVEVADDQWRKEISENLADGIERIKMDKDIDEIIATLAGTLVRVSFIQIGLMPNLSGSAKPTILKKDSLRLNTFRSVIYIQTQSQKENLFWNKQQKEIGFDAQLDLHAKFRQSKSTVPYSEWCINAKKV